MILTFIWSYLLLLYEKKHFTFFLHFTDERKSYVFGTTRRRVKYDNLIFWRDLCLYFSVICVIRDKGERSEN